MGRVRCVHERLIAVWFESADSRSPKRGSEGGPLVACQAMRQGRGLVFERFRDHDMRMAALITAGMLAVVLIAGQIPLRRGFEIDLRAPEAVGGVVQVSLVGFSVTRDFGRTAPTPADRLDVRIIANRPLPPSFELTLVGWWEDDGPETDIGVGLGNDRRSLHFGSEAVTRSVELENPDGLRVIELALPRDRTLAVQKIEVRMLGATS